MWCQSVLAAVFATIALAQTPLNEPYAAGATFLDSNGVPVGVDYARLQAQLGLVTEVVPVEVQPTAATVQYKAPNEKACSVDISTDGLRWTRKLDSGGNRARVVVMGDLARGTGYRYRVYCYYAQEIRLNLTNDYNSTLITSGNFRTPVPRR